MTRIEYRKYPDEQLRLLICLAAYGPTTTTRIIELTKINGGNLSKTKRELVKQNDIKFQGKGKTRRPGKDPDIWALASPEKIYDIIIELEYRKNIYERKIDMCRADLHRMADVIYPKIESDDGKTNDFMNKNWLPILKKRLELGAGNKGTLTEISYPAVRDWLEKLREKADVEKVPQLASQDCELLNGHKRNRPMPCSTSLSEMKKLTLRFDIKRTYQVRRDHTQEDGTVKYESAGSLFDRRT